MRVFPSPKMSITRGLPVATRRPQLMAKITQLEKKFKQIYFYTTKGRYHGFIKKPKVKSHDEAK